MTRGSPFYGRCRAELDHLRFLVRVPSRLSPRNHLGNNTIGPGPGSYSQHAQDEPSRDPHHHAPLKVVQPKQLLWGGSSRERCSSQVSDGCATSPPLPPSASGFSGSRHRLQDETSNPSGSRVCSSPHDLSHALGKPWTARKSAPLRSALVRSASLRLARLRDASAPHHGPVRELVRERVETGGTGRNALGVSA